MNVKKVERMAETSLKSEMSDSKSKAMKEPKIGVFKWKKISKALSRTNDRTGYLSYGAFSKNQKLSTIDMNDHIFYKS